MSAHEPHKRPRQVADLIHRDLAIILRRANDARLHQLSITEVDVSPDLRCARIYYTLLDDTLLDDVKKALTKGAGFLRQRLAGKITLRYVPRLDFVFDKNLENANRLSSLLSNIDTDPEDDAQ